MGERFEDYTDRLVETGADPVAYDQAEWERDGTLPAYDGLLVTAGVDIDPTRYGEEQSEYVREVAPDRDDFETALLNDAFERDMPVLAICRGHQLFNVVAGGSLVQHIHEREPHRARRGEGDAIDSGWHEVTVEPGSLLASVFGERTLRVNSRHHQAVTTDRVADGPQRRRHHRRRRRRGSRAPRQAVGRVGAVAPGARRGRRPAPALRGVRGGVPRGAR